ncbi:MULTISPECIES: TetR/AcrR family transcriptional regulator [Rhodococcus]|uniref:TetR/AcrR family transcriptional regulator n=1 Tax=Rhodococcus TaxID=1827 RepID=UPI00141DC734|nr:TetR/AcrR family transcriptional regulator [Rhodococcus opacus]NHU46408.1 TetR/AcrR family transcriptional regulator [Rhodococcus sp. A14]UZG59759.1 TetR/AcrR family transcriptional regulator [Rhodococcus opacus]
MSRSTAAHTYVEEKATPSSARGSARTEQIARAAATLFQELGYQNVSIDQIGAAVGLTGPAVYRHFKGKHGILVHALMSQVRLVDELNARADQKGSTAQEQLDLFLEGLADLTANGDEATLWRREQRHLEPAEREQFRGHFAANQHRIAAKIRAANSAIDAHKAELLGFAVLAVYSNTPDIRGNLSAERLMEIQSALAKSILDCNLPAPDPDAGSAPRPVPRQPAGRRERIIDASAKLFDERGFYDVRIDDIAKASEMSVATLYQHVTGKAQVLRAVLERGAEGLLYVTADALALATTPDEVLDALIRTYVRQALGIHGRIMHILSTDLLYLSDEEQSALRETQREYVAEWIAAICALSDELATSDARALAQAVIGVVTDVAQTPQLRERPGLAGELTVLARAMALPPSLVPK